MFCARLGNYFLFFCFFFQVFQATKSVVWGKAGFIGHGGDCGSRGLQGGVARRRGAWILRLQKGTSFFSAGDFNHVYCT